MEQVVSTKQIRWCTVVTSSLYTKERFAKEASKIGVNRAIPARVLGTLNWREPVLVADWTGEHRRVFSKKQEDGKRKVESPEGLVQTFGYFMVESVTPTGFTREARTEYYQKLKVVKMVQDLESPPLQVIRQCGSYMIVQSIEVADSVADLVKRGEEVAKKHNLKLKWFVGGPYFNLDVITAVQSKWGQGYRKIEVELDEKQVKTARLVRFIEEYKQKQYLTKKDNGVGTLDSSTH